MRPCDRLERVVDDTAQKSGAEGPAGIQLPAALIGPDEDGLNDILGECMVVRNEIGAPHGTHLIAAHERL